MATVVNCPACHRPLRVAEELIGQSVRCPSCREVFKGTAANGPPTETWVPPSATPLPTSPGVTTSPGTDLSPAPPPQPDPDTIACPSCQTPKARMLAVCHNCGYNLEGAADEDDDDHRPWERRGSRGGVRRDCEPHRGTLILVFGIVSLVTIALGIIGFIIGLPFGI